MYGSTAWTQIQGSSWEGGGPIQLPYIPQDSTTANNYRQYRNSAGIEMDSVRNPPRPAKRSRIQSDSNSLFGKTVGYLKVRKIYNWPWSLHKTIVTDIFYGNNQCVAQWLLEPGGWAFLVSAQQAGRRLFNMSLRMSSSVTSPRLFNYQFFNTLRRWGQIQCYWLLLMRSNVLWEP
jgi:hypothetical protein